MAKLKPLGGRTTPEAFQGALDALDVIGRWEWDAALDRTRADAFVALLFNLDPEEAETGIALAAYVDAIHAEDRARVLDLIRRSAREGGAFLAEYRVISVDGRTRWVLARGRFVCDRDGRPVRGGGILVDITRMRLIEDASASGAAGPAEPPLERAAEHAIAARAAILEARDAGLQARVDALLLELGRRLARQEVAARRRRMH